MVDVVDVVDVVDAAVTLISTCLQQLTLRVGCEYVEARSCRRGNRYLVERCDVSCRLAEVLGGVVSDLRGENVNFALSVWFDSHSWSPGTTPVACVSLVLRRRWNEVPASNGPPK